MPAWVSSALRPPPLDRTILVRFGGSMFDAGWFRWPGKWFQLVPGGGRQEIADPPLWWDKEAPDQSIEEERRLVFGKETTSARPVRGARQLALNWDGDDSGILSTPRGGAQNRTGRSV
jgi:hypothetical protein